jgi:hypothetical protein
MTQRIRFSMGGTTAQKLGVEDDGQRLIVKFFDKQGFVVKLLVWPIYEIHEFDCVEIDRPLTVDATGGKAPTPKAPETK